MGLTAKVQAQNSSIPIDANAQKKAIELAEFWVKELSYTQNMDVLLSVSHTPFAIDGGKIASSKQELQLFYQTVFDGKGRRELQSVSSRVVKTVSKIEEETIPVNVLIIEVTVVTNGEPHAILVTVQIGDTQKVVGFLD